MSPATVLSPDLGARLPGRRNKKTRLSYITPPLTPASSIKTATSVDSSPDLADTADEPAIVIEQGATRFLVVGHFALATTKEEVEEAVLEAGAQTLSPAAVKALDTSALQSDGELTIAFHDLRASQDAHRTFSKIEGGRLLAFLPAQSASLSVRYLTHEEAEKKLSDPLIVTDLDGSFYVSVVVEQRPWDSGKLGEGNDRALKDYLQSFGDLWKFTFIREGTEDKIPTKTFHVEFYDARDADSAYQAVHGQTVFGMTMSVYGRPGSSRANPSWTSRHVESKPKERRTTDNSTTIYSSRNHKFSVASQFTGTGTSTPTAPPPPPAHAHPAPQWEGEIRTEHLVPVCANPDRNCDYCPSRQTPHIHGPFHFPPTPSPPVAMCPPGAPPMVMSAPPLAVGIDFNYAPQIYGYSPWAFDKSIPNIPPPLVNIPPNMSMSSPAIPYSPPMSFWPGEDPTRMHGVPPYGGLGASECAFPRGMPMAPYHPPPTPLSTIARHSTPPRPTPSPPLVDSFRRLSVQNRGMRVSPELAAKNQLDISRIEHGHDTRNTVMIKNIPNKMSDKDLIAYIHEVCPRRIDFLYLRMDFKNGCNVGYAFVNFIETHDLLKFAKARLGEKWNMFSSQKVLQMSYATYQGKEALVEKFKNSCIMDEREGWRPQIFHSFGPNQGLPEPFPTPTHYGRKERGSSNRGALYVPGLHTRHNLHATDNHRSHLHMGSKGARKGFRSGVAAL